MIDRDDIRTSNSFNVSITEWELDKNIDGREDRSKDSEEEGNSVSKRDSTKDRLLYSKKLQII